MSEGGRGTSGDANIPDHHTYQDPNQNSNSAVHHYVSASPDAESPDVERPVAPDVTPEDSETEVENVHEHITPTETVVGEHSSTDVPHGHAHEDGHDDDGHTHDYSISDAKLKKVQDYCTQLCEFGFDPDELCIEFHFTCDDNNN